MHQQNNTEENNAQVRGAQDAAGILAELGATPQVPGAAGYAKFYFTTDEIMELEPIPPALIDSSGAVVLPGEGMVMLAGQTRSYKTFLAIDWAYQLAAEGKRVLFMEAEGFRAIGRRVNAFLSKHSQHRDSAVNVGWVDVKSVLQDTAFGIPSADSALDIGILPPVAFLNGLLAAIEPYGVDGAGLPIAPDVVVVDTFRTVGKVLNENDNAMVGAALKALRQLAPLVIILHHTRKDSRGYAGAGSFDTNTDTSYELRRVAEATLDGKPARVELICYGHRDHEPAPRRMYDFTLWEQSGYLAPVSDEEVKATIANDKHGATDAALLLAIEGGSTSVKAITEAMGADSERKVRYWLDSAVERGVLVKGKHSGRLVYGVNGAG